MRQTGLNEIRLDEQDWSQTNNLRWPLLSGLDFYLKTSISQLFIKRERWEDSVCLSADAGECCGQSTDKSPGLQVLWDHWSSQDTLFLLFAFHVLPLYQRMCWCFAFAARSNHLPWLCARIKSDHGEDVIFEVVNPVWVFVVFPHLAWVVDLTCATFLQISGFFVLYCFMKVFQHKSFNTCPPIWILPCFYWLMVHQPAFSILSV